MSDEAKEIAKQLRNTEEVGDRAPLAPAERRFQLIHDEGSDRSLGEQLYDALAAAKVHTAEVAMHISPEWRIGLFGQLDSLLEEEDWEPDDVPPTQASFATFIRMILSLAPGQRPGLAAATDGKLIASWTAGDDRLTIECLPDDKVRWLVSRPLDGGEIEYGTGVTDTRRLPAVLGPYDPAQWFDDAQDQNPG